MPRAPRVPVVVREVGDPLEGERVLIESNRQRVKTASEVMREAKEFKRIIERQAQQRQDEGRAKGGKAAGRGRPKGSDSSVATLPQSYQEEAKTRTQVAEAVGMKPRTFAKLEHVYNSSASSRRRRSPGCWRRRAREARRQDEGDRRRPIALCQRWHRAMKMKGRPARNWPRRSA